MNINQRYGIEITWGAVHKDGKHRVISRQASIAPPLAPACINPLCLFRYIKSVIFYVLLSTYHTNRVQYAESNRNKEILERYRTGEFSPETLWQVIHSIIKLGCPLCRKYNVDPLRGGQSWRKHKSQPN